MNLRSSVWIAVFLGMAGSMISAQSQPAAKAVPDSAQVQARVADKSPSDELNEHLPKWLRFSGEIRLRGEGVDGLGFKPDNDTGYALTRVRLNMRIQPTAWMAFVFQGQDAHILGQDEHKIASLPPYQDTFDMR
ncbi:MAG TPA: hypothetical protein VH088_04440, partial [Terriglobales bacterium]|nr:hypothetical protein [Terriglobales bacterium]